MYFDSLITSTLGASEIQKRYANIRLTVGDLFTVDINHKIGFSPHSIPTLATYNHF